MPNLFPLFFVACLQSNPTHCELRQIRLDADIQTPMQCLRVAQPVMASWAGLHGERWSIERYRCGAPPRDDGARI